MNVDANYLIREYANAVEQLNDSKSDRLVRSYWTGVKDAYHNILSAGFPGWADYDTVGYYVFSMGMTYTEAIDAAFATHEQTLLS